MIETLAGRVSHHQTLAGVCGDIARDHDSEHAAAWRIAQAIHEHAMTMGVIAQSGRVDESEIEQLGRDVSAIAEAAQNLRHQIDQALKGMSPWGALRGSLDQLERAVQKVTMR